jgi:hypothetical protein
MMAPLLMRSVCVHASITADVVQRLLVMGIGLPTRSLDAHVYTAFGMGSHNSPIRGFHYGRPLHEDLSPEVDDVCPDPSFCIQMTIILISTFMFACCVVMHMPTNCLTPLLT